MQYLNSEENYFSQDIRKGSDTTTNNQPHFALIDHLLEFVDTFKPLNYVLCGYFAKIFNNLLNLKTNNLMRYIIFSKREFLKSLVHHAYMKSISDIIIKLLSTNLSAIDNGEDVKKELLVKILDYYSDQDNEVK